MFDIKLVELMERDAELLTQRTVKDILSREETKHYRGLPENRVYERTLDVFQRLGFWLEGSKDKADIREYYTRLGGQRFQEGIPLAEVIMALMLIKRHLWNYAEENKVLTSAFEFRQSLEHNNTVVQFFDRCIYFTTIGYEAELARSAAGT
jgi:hypothetical protein